MKLPKSYDPSQCEPSIYALWETSGAFAPTGKGEPYSIVMPPPNANGNLHVGHAYMIPIEDILIRYYRMQGRDTIWIPGADHAGFETWVVFERLLEKEGKSRFDFSREELYKMTWDFVEQQRGNMELQLRALGASCDWSSSTFTLDKRVIDTVYQTFQRLWSEGLIYRGERLVNFCTSHQTSFADIEVVYEEETAPLYYIKYGPFTLATTRPETKFGDTAVAVHPDDKRYKKWVGQTVTVNGVNGDFQVKVVADEMVDPNFGTGVVKITPAHSFDDWEVAQRHNLPAISIINTDGTMNEKAGRFAGLTVAEARKAVVEAMDEQGLIEKVEKHYKTRIGHCYKCNTIIEPMLMKQWFINIRTLADRAKNAVAEGKVKFTPSQKGDELVRYYDELHDWNISRQIPWGIPIPAFQNVDDPEDWIFDTRVDQAEIVVNNTTYRRDEDTFDTWFSSGQWPFITTDYLSEGNLARFYPNSVMETGTDLLRSWVARMIMLGLYATDKVPFNDVFMHGLILDEHGQKMSKSKGNVLNPMDVINEFGSDALRMGIVMNRSAGQAQAFSPATVVAGRNFCNKLWNIARFIESQDNGEVSRKKVDNAVPHSPAENWIFAQLDQARQDIESHITNYRFAEAADTIYHVIWDDLADWFIEASKQNARPEFMHKVLNIALRLTHAFAPFVTETIWTALRDDRTTLISQAWPKQLNFDKASADEFNEVKNLVTEIRHILSDLPAGKYDLLYQDDSVVDNNIALIKSLAKLNSVNHSDAPKGLQIPSTSRVAWLDLSDDMIYEHQNRLEAKLLSVRQQIDNLKKRLLNENYITNAPANLVQETRDQLENNLALEKQLTIELTKSDK